MRLLRPWVHRIAGETRTAPGSRRMRGARATGCGWSQWHNCGRCAVAGCPAQRRSGRRDVTRPTGHMTGQPRSAANAPKTTITGRDSWSRETYTIDVTILRLSLALVAALGAGA